MYMLCSIGEILTLLLGFIDSYMLEMLFGPITYFEDFLNIMRPMDILVLEFPVEKVCDNIGIWYRPPNNIVLLVI